LQNNLELRTPTKLYFPKGIELTPAFNHLEKDLAYKDLRVTHEYNSWAKVLAGEVVRNNQGNKWKSHWFVARYGKYLLEEKVKELKAAQYKTCLLKDDGGYYTYSGLQTLVEGLTGLKTTRGFTLPERGCLPWSHIPFPPRWYQERCVELLVPDDDSRTQGAISVGTGLGKSYIMALIIKKLAVPTVVVVPTLSIAEQCLKDFTYWFGASKVGQFFDGKKKPEKFIVVAVAKSLQNVKKGSKEWNLFFDKQLLLADEAHTLPPDSLSSVFMDLLSNIPYRYSVSGTVFRDDGLGLLLTGLTGDIVFEMPVRQGIEEGFLTPLKFFMYRIESKTDEKADDPLELNKLHLRQNSLVNAHAASVAMQSVVKGRRVLILIDEVTQFDLLLKAGLKGRIGFAHGPLSKDNKDSVPIEFRKTDSMEEVEKLDNGEIDILVGTSCIGMGTDIKSADLIINLVGLSSDIRLRQGVGRGTRLFPNKKDTIFVDYWVHNNSITDRHAKARLEIFNQIYGVCKVLEVA
jgi:superfamily II DNA or RNA helicase